MATYLLYLLIWGRIATYPLYLPIQGRWHLPNYPSTYLGGDGQLYPPIQEGMATYIRIL